MQLQSGPKSYTPKVPPSDAPSDWRRIVGENIEHVRRIELQWAAGAGAYRSCVEWSCTPVEVRDERSSKVRHVLELEDGHFGAVDVCERAWSESWSKFDDENGRRDGQLKELRFKLVLYGDDGVELAAEAKKLRPATDRPVRTADDLDVHDDDSPVSAMRDPTAVAMFREFRADRRELVGTVHGLVSKIEGMAGSVEQLVQGVVNQSAVALQLQQNVLDREREGIEDERNAVVSAAAVERGFDLLDKYAGAFFVMRGVNVETGETAQLVELVAQINSHIDDEVWRKLERIDAETFGDLRAALQLDTDDELRAALQVALPPVRTFGAQALPVLPPAVLPLLERLRVLVFPEVP